MINQAAKKRLQIFFTFLILFSCFTKTEVSSWNDASRMATVESLVKYHTFIIDNSDFFATGDKYFYQNHFYSDKPPVLSLYTSVFYWCLNRIHISFDSHPALSYYLLTVLVIGVISSLGLVCLYEILNTFKINHNWSNIILLIAGTGTLVLPYSVVFNNHVVSGSLLIFSFYYLLPPSVIKRQYEGKQKKISFNVRRLIQFYSNSTRQVKNSSTINKHRGLDAQAFDIPPYASEVKYAAISGFFITLAGSIDITMFLLIPLYFILLINKPLSVKIAFILSCVPMTIIYIFLNIYTSGSIIPAAMNASLWNYPGSHFGESNLSGLVQQDVGNLRVYAFNMLLGSRGFISYSPIILFSIYGWMKMFFQPNKYKKEYLFIAAVVIAFLLFYIFRTNNYSGYSYGVRWFASIMLLACIPIAHVAEEVKSKLLAGMFVAIACFSIFISFIGLIAPFGGVQQVNYSSFFLGLERFNQQPLWVKAKLVLVLIVVYSVFYRLFEEFKKSQDRQSEKSTLQERV